MYTTRQVSPSLIQIRLDGKHLCYAASRAGALALITRLSAG